MRTFVSLRKFQTNFNDLREAIQQIEEEMNTQFKDIHQAINYLLQKDELQVIREIGNGSVSRRKSDRITNRLYQQIVHKTPIFQTHNFQKIKMCRHILLTTSVY